MEDGFSVLLVALCNLGRMCDRYGLLVASLWFFAGCFQFEFWLVWPRTNLKAFTKLFASISS